MASSIAVLPSITSPSTGNFSPGLTRITSPTTTSSRGTVTSTLFLITVAVFGAKPISFLMASEVLPFDLASKYLPNVISAKIVAADS